MQLKLLNPRAPYFEHADLLIAADCVPFAFADFHRDFLKGKIVIIFCPKLDTDIDGYIAKLADIFSGHTINSITILHMEVPCCSGVTYIVNTGPGAIGKENSLKGDHHLDRRTGGVILSPHHFLWRSSPFPDGTFSHVLFGHHQKPPLR